MADQDLKTLFRLGGDPIPCPFAGPPFSFSYSKGYGECNVTQNQAESCTDDSKMLLKYQACPDVKGTESTSKDIKI